MELFYQSTVAKTFQVIFLQSLSADISATRRKKNQDRLDELPSELQDFDFEIAENEADCEQYDSLENINEKIEAITHQLDRAKAIRDKTDFDRLKAIALERTKIEIIANHAEGVPDSILLNLDQDKGENPLTDAQLALLVNQAVDALIERNFAFLQNEEAGQLRQHLGACREKQNEYRTNAAGSLLTYVIGEEGSHVLSESQIRDPIDRTCFIDTHFCIESKDFRDIIIGGCLRLGTNPFVPLPESISSYLSEEMLDEPNYETKAILKYIDFRLGNIALPLEQKQVLVCLSSDEQFDLLAKVGLFAGSKRKFDASSSEDDHTGVPVAVKQDVVLDGSIDSSFSLV